jgi:farnesyl diphosphate synthase/geranylgeranyl diphosphate synthase type II
VTTDPLARYRARIESVLDRCLALPGGATPRLREAMRYSVLGGGKRLRPALVYASGMALGARLEALDAPAAAVELIHVYSLVHDDLPAMDDDDLRRGRPTCHRAFDEATAVLVGDALQALAFEILADPAAVPTAAASQRLGTIALLAHSIGTGGMAGGQAIDLESVGQRLDVAALEAMHRRKTGALIEASVLIGARTAGVTDGPAYAALRRFGIDVGLAFQIQDDILDVEGETGAIGKRAGADALRDKPTYPSMIGLEAARQRASALLDSAIAALAPLGSGAAELADMARFVAARAH